LCDAKLRKIRKNVLVLFFSFRHKIAQKLVNRVQEKEGNKTKEKLTRASQ
jgi:hypothetical protein